MRYALFKTCIAAVAVLAVVAPAQGAAGLKMPAPRNPDPDVKYQRPFQIGP